MSEMQTPPKMSSSRQRLMAKCAVALMLLPLTHCDVIGEEIAAMGHVATQVRQARGTLTASPETESQIKTSSWELLFGELAVEGGEDLSLWSSALDCFDAGFQRLTEAEKELESKSDAGEEFHVDATSVMQLDAMRVRKTSIEQRQQLARDQERARLNQLRAMIQSFRSAAERMARADFYSRVGDYQLASKANAEFLSAIDAIYKDASARRDYYLFTDEPRLDGTDEFGRVQATVEPLSADLIAHTKALHALVLFQLASKQEEQERASLLKQSVGWAESALHGTSIEGVEVPDGHDNDNVIALHVLGLANEQLGVEITRRSPSDSAAHKAAANYFTAAKLQLGKAVETLAAMDLSDSALDRLRSEAEKRLLYLQNEDASVKEADQASAQGLTLKAWGILQDAALRHRSNVVWTRMIEAARRSGSNPTDLLAEVGNAFDSGLFVGGEPGAELVRAKVALAAVWTTIAAKGVPTLSATELDIASQNATLALQGLQAGLQNVAEEAMRAELEAHLALARVYQAVLSPGNSEADNWLKDAYRLAQSSASVLGKAIGNQNTPGDQSISLREALIASRLACGHACVRILPDYRDEGLLAFAAAFDETAKLPFRLGDLKLLGSPMITALTNRPNEASSRLAVEERRYRQLVTRFLEGMYTLHFGDSAAAADQIGDALEGALRTGGEPGAEVGPRDATAMLGQADGFDVEVTLQDSVRAFKVLADSAAGRNEVALLEAVALLVGDSTVDSVDQLTGELLEQAVRNIQSPLVGFALVNALEARVTALDLDSQKQRDTILRAIAQSQSRITELFQAEAIRQRFPHLIQLHEESVARFASDDSFTIQANTLRGRGDLTGALVVLEDGLRRHPRSERLWQGMLDARIEETRRTGATESDLKKLLANTEQAKDAGMLSPFLNDYYHGTILEFLGNHDMALQSFMQALKAASSPQDRIRTRSRISEIQTHLSVAGT